MPVFEPPVRTGNSNPLTASEESQRKSISPASRLRQILWHVPWYGFRTQARLAEDSGVSASAISRMMRGESQPSLQNAISVTAAISRRLGRALDLREVFSTDGLYPTPSVCQLVGCHCLPPNAYDEDDNLKTEFLDVRPGEWSQANLTQQKGGR